MRNSEDNWKRYFKSELVLQQHCHPVSNWVRSEKWNERSDAMQLQKILFTLLLETLMNESGNEAPVRSQAFSQSWAETKKSCRHYLSYQLPATLETVLDSYVLASVERTALSWLYSFLSSRSHEAPDRRLLLLSVTCDMKSATGLNSSTISI